MNGVVDLDGARRRILEPHHRQYARTGIAAITPPSVVARLLASRGLVGAQLRQFFLGAIATIGGSRCKHGIDDLLVAIEALGLKVGALVVVKTSPCHARQDLLYGLVSGAFQVRVFDP